MKTPLTEEHAQMLREALRGHHLETIITVALDTGMRRDELLHLRWQDLDLEKREGRVQNTKTPHEHRIIHLSAESAERLQHHHLHQMEARLQVGSTWENLDLVFPDSTGRVLSPEQLLQDWYELLAHATLPPLQFHDLRASRWRALIAG